ncbi:TIM barrel protein [Novosphingobium jiangmenense]|uniref:Sugar phosphate isomerase/epimerase n=1 Tax=Novosphingobium jiangmenense TaxID=2791981 RepID=A0ABS0HBS3_9SPHN|nr:sugar phosphate isomerase/epimerase [Novosphingobium jiangmenense]
MTARGGHPGPFSFNHFCRSLWYSLTPDLPGAIKACARAGFDQFAPDCLSLAAWQEQGGTLAELARLLRDAGLATGPLAACAMIDGSAAALDQLAGAARMAEVLGTSILQINVTGPDADLRAAAVEAACDMLGAYGEFRLALEYMPISGLATLAETLEIVARVGEARAGVLVDIWHHAHDPDGWQTLAGAPLGAIAYVEIDDALPPEGEDLLAEMMDRRTFPGEGVLETARFAKLLRERGYDGPVSVEVLNRKLAAEPIGWFATRAIETSRSLFAG